MSSIPSASNNKGYEMVPQQEGKDGLDDRSLPPPVQQVPPEKKVHPAIIIAIWIFLSGSVIIYNKYILDPESLNWPYPIALVAWHLSFATIATRIMYRTTRLLEGVDSVQMSWDRWFRSIVPIGALFSASLIFSNMAYLTLTVSFIQMLKAFTSVAVLGMSVLFGLETPNRRTLVIVLFISLGVAVASYGEINFVMSGFICQAIGIAFEAARLVAIQKLLHGLKMDPLVSLYYFAPVCAGLNLLLIPFYEGADPFNTAIEQLGFVVLFTNAATALLLNISVVFVISAASSLVYTLCGVLKDILLVVVSLLLFGKPVTSIQFFGYAIALAGLFVFKTKKEVMDGYIEAVKARLRG
ncbi:TPT-domain-containing protein [Atractiella rhizophila]|nr:TPT-domain-containing protein [Atractiella rhizophila]